MLIEPPYYAVIFTSQRNEADPAYDAMAERMMQLAAEQEGFLGVESSRDARGLGITVSYWRSQEALTRWKAQSEHRAAQELGKNRWYRGYTVRIAIVERAYGFHEDEGSNPVARE